VEIGDAALKSPLKVLLNKQLPWLAIWLPLAALLGLSPASAQATGDGSIWLPLIFNPPFASNPVHTGIATYYSATGDGACLFGPSPGDLMVSTMNAEEYNTAAACGAYVHVVGPKGEVTVRIVDLCPECRAGHLDLSRGAFALIADPPQGQVGDHFKDGSNQWWTAVQVRNHRNPIAKLKYLDADGQWVAVPRTAYNYFVQTNPGMGPGPYAFRVTDSYGNVLG